MDIILISSGAMFLRIAILGAERIFLKKLQDFDSLAISALFSLIASFSLLPLLVIIPDIWQKFLIITPYALLASLSYTVAFYLYVYAISVEDASLIAPLYNSSLFFIFIFGFTFLGEGISILRVGGGALMFVGIFILYPGNIKERIQAIRTSRGSVAMFVGSIFLAVGRTIDTISVRQTVPDPTLSMLYALLLYFYVGVYTLILVLLSGRGKELLRPFRVDIKNTLLAGIANGWAYMFLLVAVQGIDLSVAVPLSLLSVFVTAILARTFLAEEIVQRLPGTVLLTGGALLLLF